MIETYALTKKGSEQPIEIGSLAGMVHAWGELKYRNAPDEEYSVKRIRITTVKEFAEEEIGILLEQSYVPMGVE